MAAAGLVTKERAPDDGRAQVVRATAQGRRMRRHAVPVIAELNDRIRGPLSEKEEAIVAGFLLRVMDDP